MQFKNIKKWNNRGRGGSLQGRCWFGGRGRKPARVMLLADLRAAQGCWGRNWLWHLSKQNRLCRGL